MTMESKKHRRIWQFDAMRGLLSFWVLLEHLHHFFPVRVPSGIARFKEYLLAANAVDVFIVLSGFVISLVLEN